MSGLALLLSSSTGSHPDLIQAAGAGETFICGDIGNLRDKMSYFVENPSVRIAYKKAAIFESTKYSETSFCDIFEETVSRLLDFAPADLETSTPGPNRCRTNHV